MAINSVLLIPKSGEDVLTKNLLDNLTILSGNNDEKIKSLISNLALRLNVNTIKNFFTLNYFCNSFDVTECKFLNKSRMEKTIGTYKYYRKLFDAANRLLGLNLNIDVNYNKRMYEDLYTKTLGLISELNIDKSMLIDGNYLSRELSIVLGSLFINNKEYIPTVLKLVTGQYTLPFIGNKLLMLIIDEEVYEKLFNTICAVTVQYLNINDNVLNLSCNRDVLYGVIRYVIEDIIKETIVKEPDIGEIIVDSEMANYDKSFILLPTGR